MVPNVFRKRFPGKVPKRFQARFPGTGKAPRKFPGKVTRNRLQGFPMFSGRGSQARFPRGSKQGSQEQAALPGRCSQARFSGRGSQAKFPGIGFARTVFRNRFQGFQSTFPKQDFQEHIFPKQNKFPRTGFPASVSRKKFPRRGVQARFPAS